MKADMISEQCGINELVDGDYIIHDSELLKVDGSASYNRYTYNWHIRVYGRSDPVEIYESPESLYHPRVTKVSAVIRL